MKILITGGKGFIAKGLVEGLKHQVMAFDKEELDLLKPDKVFDCLKDNHFDAVVHTAVYDTAAKHSTKDPTMVLENNIRMFFNLLRGRKYFGKLIFFGSGAEYSREHLMPKMKETYFDHYVPNDQYGFSRYIATKYAIGNIYNLRLFSVFGKDDDWQTRFIPNACCRAVMDLPIRIEQNRLVDFLWLGDLAAIVDWFITHQPKHNVYNVCSGKVIDRLTIAKKIITISGKDLAIKTAKEGFDQEYSGDNSLLMKELNFKFSPFNDKLKELYHWYERKKS